MTGMQDVGNRVCGVCVVGCEKINHDLMEEQPVLLTTGLSPTLIAMSF